jgi:hypothetical protein
VSGDRCDVISRGRWWHAYIPVWQIIANAGRDGNGNGVHSDKGVPLGLVGQKARTRPGPGRRKSWETAAGISEGISTSGSRVTDEWAIHAMMKVSRASPQKLIMTHMHPYVTRREVNAWLRLSPREPVQKIPLIAVRWCRHGYGVSEPEHAQNEQLYTCGMRFPYVVGNGGETLRYQTPIANDDDQCTYPLPTLI